MQDIFSSFLLSPPYEVCIKQQKQRLIYRWVSALYNELACWLKIFPRTYFTQQNSSGFSPDFLKLTAPRSDHAWLCCLYFHNTPPKAILSRIFKRKLFVNYYSNFPFLSNRELTLTNSRGTSFMLYFFHLIWANATKQNSFMMQLLQTTNTDRLFLYSVQILKWPKIRWLLSMMS
mgnify:CR=1 FL=1